MEDEDDIFENQVEFIAERDVWNRIGGADIGLGLGGAINLKKSGYTNEEKFKLIAAATIKIINDYEELLSNPSLTRMLSLVDHIPDFEYKNPAAFAMGYIVALSSNYTTLEIDRDMLETVFKINVDIDDKIFSKIENVDILRYARLCLLNKLK
jgi:hypothetical protein